MSDNRSDKVKRICKEFIENGCRDTCPLAVPCEAKKDDTKAIFDNRINAAAFNLEGYNLGR